MAVILSKMGSLLTPEKKCKSENPPLGAFQILGEGLKSGSQKRLQYQGRPGKPVGFFVFSTVVNTINGIV